MVKKVTNKEQQEITVNPNTFTGSLYSQLVGVNVSNTEVTLEFVYLHPKKQSEGQVIARVTLPRSVAQELSEVIANTIKQHDSKQ